VKEIARCRVEKQELYWRRTKSAPRIDGSQNHRTIIFVSVIKVVKQDMIIKFKKKIPEMPCYSLLTTATAVLHH